MTLTAEQEAAIQEAVTQLFKAEFYPDTGAKYAEILRDLARRLLEPVEKEKA